MKTTARIVILCLCVFLCFNGNGYAVTMKNEMSYAPAGSDVFLYADMQLAYSFLTRRGVPSDDIFLIAGDAGSRQIESFLGAFRIKPSDLAEIVFAGTSSEMKPNAGFLVFVKTLRPATAPAESASAGVKLSGNMIYPVPGNPEIWIYCGEKVSVIGARETLGAYLALKKKGTPQKNPLMENFITSAQGKSFYGRVDLSQSMRDMMRMGFALGAGKAQGLEKNIFINAILNLKSIEYGIDSDKDVMFTFGWQAQNKEDGERLVMVSHFAIVAASLAVSFIDVSAKNPAAEKDMEKLQSMFGRIRTTRTDNGVLFSVTLTDEECAAIVDAVKGQIVNAKEEAKERILREKISVLNDRIRSGDLAAVKKMLDEKIPVNTPASDGVLPLVAACEKGNQEMASLLLDRGAEINGSSDDGTTPLLAAAGAGSVPLVKFLLGRDGDIQGTNTLGETVLHRASEKGDMTMLRLFMEKEINVNAGTNDGSTPLHVAAMNGHLEAVTFLVEKGADPMIEDSEGMRPSQRAQEKGFDAIVKFLNGHEKKYEGEAPLENDTPGEEEGVQQE